MRKIGLILGLMAIMCQVNAQQVPAPEASTVVDTSITALKAKLLSTMVNNPAPDFTLNDINGKQVKLADLKGKVVVVDFWATWCGPCKMSLPGMQLAVDQYKNNKDVVFLFVNTWEKGTPDEIKAKVGAFIAENKYRFNVVMDKQVETTGARPKYEVVSAYKLKGIPTKFIIDKKGAIRFVAEGLVSADANDIAKEVSAMISLATEKS